MQDTNPARPRKGSGHPRYRELSDVLQKEIETEKFPVGSRMPTELELCERFDVSRFTVREALRRLIDLGMVLRRQGSGTVVISRNPATKFVQRLNSIEELLQYSKDTRLKVHGSNDVRVSSQEAAMIGCEPEDNWHKIEGIRFLDDKSPICWTDVFVQPAYKELADQIGKDETPVFMAFEKKFGVIAESVSMDLFAGSIEQSKAWALGVEPNSPSLIIVRRYKDQNGKTFEVSVSEHPAGRFTFSIDLARSADSD